MVNIAPAMRRKQVPKHISFYLRKSDQHRDHTRFMNSIVQVQRSSSHNEMMAYAQQALERSFEIWQKTTLSSNVPQLTDTLAH